MLRSIQRPLRSVAQTFQAAAMSGVTVSPVSDPRPRPDNYRAHHPPSSSSSSQEAFRNPWPSWAGMAPPIQFAKASITGKIRAKSVPSDMETRVNWQTPRFSYDPDTASQCKVAWLGHASMFIELPACTTTSSRGLRILCDPVFSDRCSPVQWMGPKRYTPPALTTSTVPEVDLLLLSHNHYDHLDHHTITTLAQRFPKLHFIVPLRVKAWFTSAGIAASRVTELDWWDEVVVQQEEGTEARGGNAESVRIGYLPAQHFTGRFLRDQGHTLWGSYTLESRARDGTCKKIWFAGDTGRRTIPQSIELSLESGDAAVRQQAESDLAALPVCPAHAEIGDLRGPFDLAIIPIGAYSPRYLMSPVHVDPAEAIDIFKEVKAARAVGIHWGTFVLSAEDVLEPRRRLQELCSESDVHGFECWDMGKIMYI